jgi:WD40 repeat protein
LRSRDDAHALSGSSDETIRLWDMATRALLRTFEGRSVSLKSVAFSPDWPPDKGGAHNNHRVQPLVNLNR